MLNDCNPITKVDDTLTIFWRLFLAPVSGARNHDILSQQMIWAEKKQR